MRTFKKWMLAAIRPLVLTMVFCGTNVFMACSSKEDTPVPQDPESEKSDVVDYSDKNNWMRQPEATKDVDAFLSIPRNMTTPLRAHRNLLPSMNQP